MGQVWSFQAAGRIFGERIVAQIDVIDQPLAALPYERRHLPGLILRHECDQRLGAGGVIGLDVEPEALRTLDQLILDRRAPFEDAGKVLDALLPRVGRFRGTHRVRYVTHEHDSEFLRFVGRREVPLAWNQRLDLDEIDTACL